MFLSALFKSYRDNERVTMTVSYSYELQTLPSAEIKYGTLRSQSEVLTIQLPRRFIKRETEKDECWI